MATILIVGAGRVGLAVAKLVRHTSGHQLVIVDADAKARVSDICDFLGPVGVPFTVLEADAATEELSDIFERWKPDLTFCTVPYQLTARVAELAANHRSSYIDFTEDMAVSEAIASLSVEGCTFVPQTGLAPGLINYMALELAAQLGETPDTVDMYVGALPRVGVGAHAYAITWSPDGLINEYLKPSWIKRQHQVVKARSLDERQALWLDGRQYEAFLTSGGTGNLSAYTGIANVTYRSLRSPGHLEYIEELLLAFPEHAQAVEAIKRHVPTTRNDYVVTTATVTRAGRQVSDFTMFYGDDTLRLTALELTTAGTGVAVGELILSGLLPYGLLDARSISLQLLKGTKAGRLVFARSRQ